MSRIPSLAHIYTPRHWVCRCPLTAALGNLGSVDIFDSDLELLCGEQIPVSPGRVTISWG